MASNTGEPPGLNLLSLDGGGITGLSSLYILREIMNRLQEATRRRSRPEPHEYFDLIAGTGTGAISAVMLGRLRMSMDDTISRYNRLASDMFSEQNTMPGSGMFNEANFEKGLRKIVRKATGNADEMMMEENPQEVKCKVVIYAMFKRNMNASLPCALRTYPANANAMPDCPIWKALRASTAHPELFRSAEIEELGIKFDLIGGAYGCNNPTAQLLKEASTLFPDRFVATVTSIGTGHASTIQIPHPTRIGRALPFRDSVTLQVLKAAQGIATDNERVAEEMADRFSRTEGVYCRLNVDQGMQGIEASEWERRSEVASHAKNYLRLSAVNRRLNRLVTAVRDRRAKLSAIHIDGHIPTLVQAGPAGQTAAPIDNNTRPPSSSIPIGLKYCPRPTFMFKGRKLQLRKASNYFGNEEQQHVFVIHGLGGAGKTQMALKCAELMAKRFEGVLFIDGSSRNAIEEALAQFATAMNIGKEYMVTLRWLETRKGRWLILFDNVDDPEVRVHEYFPRSNRFDVLITTRHQTVVRLARGRDSECKIDELDPEDALELLLEASGSRKDGLQGREIMAATKLMQEFGNLALAIVQCGAFICRTQCSFTGYLDMYLKERRGTLEGDGATTFKVEGYDRSVYTTWALNHSSAKPIFLPETSQRHGSPREYFGTLRSTPGEALVVNESSQFPPLFVLVWTCLSDIT